MVGRVTISATGKAKAARLSFARTMGLAAHDPGGPIEQAFAATPREHFLGPGACADPAEVYRDTVIALVPEKRINNGQPSLHAACLAMLQPKRGESVVHVGAGAGYYTAILARLVGDGQVDAYEIEPSLAQLARENLAPFANVRVHAASAAEGPLPRCDMLYVNAGATRPLANWLDALKPAGRLLFPLTGEGGTGGMTLISPAGEHVFSAQISIPVGFIPCTGARDPAQARALTDLFRRGAWMSVKSLRRHCPPDESCWFAADDCWFSTRPPDE